LTLPRHGPEILSEPIAPAERAARPPSARNFAATFAALAAIGLLALALRLAWIAYSEFAPTYNDDAGRYDYIGRMLADGRGYIDIRAEATMFWPPGYPFLLAAIYKAYPERIFGAGHQVDAALVINAIFGVATVLLVYALARRAFSRIVALCSALITACFPSLVMLTATTLTETVFTTIALAALLLVVIAREREDPRLLIVAGFCFGIGALVRGPGLLLPLATLPYLWMTSPAPARRALPRAFVLSFAILACALVVVLPWTIRNLSHSGSLVLISSNAGPDFYIGHSDDADGGGRRADDLVFAYPERSQPEAEAAFNREGFERGLEFAAAHPWREIQLAGLKIWHLYKTDHAALRWNESHGENDFLGHDERQWWVRAINAYYYAALAFAGVGTLATVAGLVPVSRLRAVASNATPAHRSVRVLLLSVIAYWTLVHVAFFGDPRFHAPIMPIVGIFAAFGAAVALRLCAGTAAVVRRRIKPA
jgi:4-amino-4-deoxy-L-arabinose transferase-like glycosyltransferase